VREQYKKDHILFRCEHCKKDFNIHVKKTYKVNLRFLDRKKNRKGREGWCPECKNSMFTEGDVERGQPAKARRKATKRILGTDFKVIDRPETDYFIPSDLKDALEEEKRLRAQREKDVKGKEEAREDDEAPRGTLSEGEG